MCQFKNTLHHKLWPFKQSHSPVQKNTGHTSRVSHTMFLKNRCINAVFGNKQYLFENQAEDGNTL